MSDPTQISAAFPENNLNSNGIQVTPITPFTFDPYKSLSAVNQFLALNSMVNRMFGVDTVWFRAVPQQRSKDVIFQEYTLSNVSDTPICIKAMLNQGAAPDGKYNYDLMGLEYEIPFEVQVDKIYWEELAGKGTAPQRKDIVYVRISNRLYQVDSTYLRRGFMEQETTWVINLKKYQPEASRRESAALIDTIDKYTVGEEELFAIETLNEIEKLTNGKEFSQFNNTVRDKYKHLDKKLKVVLNQMNIYGTIVAESYYDLNSCSGVTAISYNIGDVITDKNDRSLLIWVKPMTLSSTIYNVESIIPTSTKNRFTVKITAGKNFNIGDVFNISKSGSLIMFGYVVEDLGSNNYNIDIPNDVVNYLKNIKLDWYDARNYKMVSKNPINLISGLNTSSPSLLSVDVYSNQFIKVVLGDSVSTVVIPDRLSDGEWYGVVLNIGNSWNQYNINLYKRHQFDNDIKLQNFYSGEFNLTPSTLGISSFAINKSESYITNIRFFNTTVEDEKQSNELLTYNTKDANQGLILDNCDPLYKAPYISKIGASEPGDI
jgi:hypothetical protein